jgi:hypothetical protein
MSARSPGMRALASESKASQTTMALDVPLTDIIEGSKQWRRALAILWLAQESGQARRQAPRRRPTGNTSFLQLWAFVTGNLMGFNIGAIGLW